MTTHVESFDCYHNPYDGDGNNDDLVYDFYNQARLFGCMLDLIEGKVKYYKSDLYYDAGWIKDCVPSKWKLNDSFTFWFGCRETGTSIGTEFEYIGPYNDHVFKLQLNATKSKFADERDRINLILTVTTDVRSGINNG